MSCLQIRKKVQNIPGSVREMSKTQQRDIMLSKRLSRIKYNQMIVFNEQREYCYIGNNVKKLFFYVFVHVSKFINSYKWVVWVRLWRKRQTCLSWKLSKIMKCDLMVLRDALMAKYLFNICFIFVDLFICCKIILFILNWKQIRINQSRNTVENDYYARYSY